MIGLNLINERNIKKLRSVDIEMLLFFDIVCILQIRRMNRTPEPRSMGKLLKPQPLGMNPMPTKA